MFEFDDAKLGKVKVVNVTEARSSMASIMNDRSCSYVITRNNRPIRVILSYDKAGSFSAADLSRGVREATPSHVLAERRIVEPSHKKEVRENKESVAPPSVSSDQASVKNTGAKEEEDHSISALSKSGSDYFQRFKKLYEPIPEPAAPKPAPPKQELVLKVESAKGPPAIAREPVATDLDEVIPEPPRETQAVGRERSMPPVSPKESQPLDPPRSGREAPSIQDLLRELEQEKLSGEEDDLSPLNSSDLRRLFHDIS